MLLGPICELAAQVGTLTPAVVSAVRARQAPGGVEVEWETASEVGTAGFDLLRWDPATGGYAKLNKRLLPALQGAPQGDATASSTRPLPWWARPGTWCRR